MLRKLLILCASVMIGGTLLSLLYALDGCAPSRPTIHEMQAELARVIVRSNDTVGIALTRNPWTGQTLPRGAFARWTLAGADCTIASLDSLSAESYRIEGRNWMTGRAEQTRARVPIAGEWTLLASRDICVDDVPDTLPAAVLARAHNLQWDEEYRNPGYLILARGGAAVTWSVDSLDGMYREPDGWVRKVRIFEDGRQWFVRVRDRDSTVVQPWIPSWSPSYDD